jgi:hypothetical protein
VDKLPRRLPGEEHEQYSVKLSEHFEELLKKKFGPSDKPRVIETTLCRDYDGAITSFMNQGKLQLETQELQLKINTLRTKKKVKIQKTIRVQLKIRKFSEVVFRFLDFSRSSSKIAN